MSGIDVNGGEHGAEVAAVLQARLQFGQLFLREGIARLYRIEAVDHLARVALQALYL